MRREPEIVHACAIDVERPTRCALAQRYHIHGEPSREPRDEPAQRGDLAPIIVRIEAAGNDEADAHGHRVQRPSACGSFSGMSRRAQSSSTGCAYVSVAYRHDDSALSTVLPQAGVR